MARPTIAEVARYFPYVSLRDSNRSKRLAGRAITSAVASGRLLRQPCEVCGRKRGIQAHHEDYEKPLDVKWLCRVHHARRHAEIRESNNKTIRAAAALPLPLARAEDLARSGYKRCLKQPEVSRPLVTAATVALVEALAAEGISANKLASRVGISRQSLSMHLGGGVRNLRSLATLADAIGYDVHISLMKRQKAEVA